MANAELTMLEGKIAHLLDNAGTMVRYALGQDEKAIDLALSAATRALSDAGMSAESVELVLYAGVGRAFIEPAMANVIQSELGLSNATCFDVLDGCTSWLRALQVADQYLRSKAYTRALIVNCECAFGRYVDSQIGRLDDLESCFATLTIGEASTATIVDGSQPNNFYFNFKNFGEHYGLCMIPLEDAPEFLRSEQGSRAPMRLFSLSRHLLAFAADRIVEMFDGDPNLQGPFDICFGHAASKRAEEGVLRRLGIPLDRYFGTHATHGNTVSAAVPLAMSLAVEAGQLKRGSRVLAITAAGGIAVGLARFTF